MEKKIGRPAYKVVLSESDRKFLEGVIRATTSPQSHVTRAKIALGAADGLSHEEIVKLSGAVNVRIVDAFACFQINGHLAILSRF